MTPTEPIDHDATPPGGGSYTRQPDGSLVRNTEPEPTTPAAEQAPQE